jgi:hypothetical protein
MYVKVRKKFKPGVNANLLQAIYILCLVLIEIRYKSGPVGLRMATASSDDNSFISTMVRSKSDVYNQDFYAQLITIIQSNSAISWMVKIQHELFNLSFEHIWLEIFTLQRIFLYISIIPLTKLVTKNKITPYFVVLAISATNPYYWNLGWFGALDDQPYPMWFATPFFVLAFVSLNKYKNKIAYGYYLLGFFIHPSFGILVGIFFILDDIRKNFSYLVLTHKLKAYLSTSIIPVLYILISKILEPKQMALPEDIKAIAFTNQHLDFFNVLTSDFTLLTVRIWVLTLCVYVLAKLNLKHLNKGNLAKQLELMLLSLFAFLILHWLVLELEFVPGIILFGPRFSVFFILISFVYFAVYLIEGFSKVNALQKLTYLSTMLMPSVGIILIFTFFETIKHKSTNHRKLLDLFQAVCVIFVITVSSGNKLLTFISPSSALEYDKSWLSNSFFNTQNTGFTSYLLSAFSTNSILFIALCFLTISVLFFELTFARVDKIRKRILKQKTKAQVVVLLFLTGSLATGLKYEYQWSFSGVNLSQVQDYAAVQKWARENTPIDSYYFTDGSTPFFSWRTYSERPGVYPNMVWSLYNYPEFINEHNIEWKQWWKNSIQTGQSDFIGQWDTNFFCKSRSLLGTDYIVRNFEQQKLDFPIIFSNSHFIVHKVVCNGE